MVMHRPTHSPRGFTLIELLVVLAIVALMLTIVAPRTIEHIDRSREVALKASLKEMRRALDQYEADTGHPPASLDDLVSARYVREIPVDPITNRRDSWIGVSALEYDAVRSTTAGPHSVVAGASRVAASPSALDGLVDIRSGAAGNGRDGTPYREW